MNYIFLTHSLFLTTKTSWWWEKVNYIPWQKHNKMGRSCSRIKCFSFVSLLCGVGVGVGVDYSMKRTVMPFCSPHSACRRRNTTTFDTSLTMLPVFPTHPCHVHSWKWLYWFSPWPLSAIFHEATSRLSSKRSAWKLTGAEATGKTALVRARVYCSLEVQKQIVWHVMASRINECLWQFFKLTNFEFFLKMFLKFVFGQDKRKVFFLLELV